MTYLPKLFITAVLAWISFAGSFTSQGVDFLQRASAAALGGSLATVNGQAITQAMYDEYAHERRVARKQKEAVPGEEPVILAELISMELMVQEAKKKGLDNKPELKNLTPYARRVSLAKLALQNYMDAHPVTDDDIKKFYDASFQARTEYQARHILVKTESEGKAIIAKLEQGADFSKLAKENSVDTQSAEKGGDLGWFNENGMDPSFIAAVAMLSKGEHSKTPAKSAYGWHIVELRDSRLTQPPSFERMKDTLLPYAQNNRAMEWLEQLKSGVKIEVDPALALPAAGAGAKEPAAATSKSASPP